MVSSEIIKKLPYKTPFLFVDDILEVDENHIVGTYIYDAALDFYKGHFTGHPVTPGVILTETMAQIGVACFGIYLMGVKDGNMPKIAMTSAESEYLKPVFPGEKVVVTGEKIYFRFGKLKCRVQMENANQEIVCTGLIAGIILNE